ATSAHSGTGIAELKAALEQICGTLDLLGEPAASAAGAPGAFRMAIDRAFVVQGHGTVVTGSIASGSVKIGEELDWHSGNGVLEKVRVRGLNHHNQAVECAHQGQRAAINLASAPHERVRRGQELASPHWLLPSKVLTVRLTTSREAYRPIKHRLPVRMHIGTAEVMATVSLLESNRVEPGDWGLAQLFLVEHATATWGQPFVLRDSSAETTLGGGWVVQPAAVKIRRRQPESLRWLSQLGSNDADKRILAAAWFEEFEGIVARDLARKTGLPEADLVARLDRLVIEGKLVQLPLASFHKLTVHAERLAELEDRMLEALAALHAESPLATAFDRQKLQARFVYLDDVFLVRGVLDRLIEQKRVLGDADRAAHPDFQPKLSANQRKLKDQIVAAIAAGRFQPPEPKELSRLAGGNAAAIREILTVAVAEGLLVKVTDEIYLHGDAEGEMCRRVVERLQSGTGATVSEIRELLQTTRKYAVPLCEYLDRIGVTQREGDVRVLGPRSAAPRGDIQ
ncbi:MAG TPA: SelB C-terminal domain-containing protein, partial [Gemmataceae bacterium]